MFFIHGVQRKAFFAAYLIGHLWFKAKSMKNCLTRDWNLPCDGGGVDLDNILQTPDVGQ